MLSHAIPSLFFDEKEIPLYLCVFSMKSIFLRNNEKRKKRRKEDL
jgi:hypothetical protein